MIDDSEGLLRMGCVAEITDGLLDCGLITSGFGLFIGVYLLLENQLPILPILPIFGYKIHIFRIFSSSAVLDRLLSDV